MSCIQLHLEEELDDALARQALDRGIPKAALIREYLASHVPAGGAGGDPSEELVGIYGGDPDESATVDEVLSGR